MMWTVAFSRGLYDDLERFLFSTAPNENGCFLLANSYKTKTMSILVVTDIIKPAKDSWTDSNRCALEFDSSFINQAVVTSDMAQCSLIFVHTHPSIIHPSTFSQIDKKSNRKMFANISTILPDRPLGSLVFSRKGICGVVHENNKLQNVNRIKIIGDKLVEFPGIGFHKKRSRKTGGRFDRQIKAFGHQNQQKLQNVAVTIVGAGGTGSAVAVQLARMGVKNLQLVDMDVVDETNIPRIYGSKNTDIGKPKVEVLKKHIRTFSKLKVDAIYDDVTNKQMRERISGSDVIFACTDNLASRATLNEISRKYYIPLIDVGCRILLDEDRSILHANVKVQVVTPDSACLWCTGTLDGTAILQESLSEEEKMSLAKEGYYSTVEDQPSIISLTTMAASMAVTKLLNVIEVLGSQYSSRTQIELKDEIVTNDNPEIKTDCICQKNRYGESSKKDQQASKSINI